jgi:hypothetical protein
MRIVYRKPVPQTLPTAPDESARLEVVDRFADCFGLDPTKRLVPRILKSQNAARSSPPMTNEAAFAT